MKKTILEWYEQLPEPIRSQAIENFNNGRFDVTETSDALSSALYVGGWAWIESPQNGQYWANVCERASQGEFDTPIESDLVKAARKVVEYKDLEMDGDLYAAIHELEKLLK